MSDSTSAPSGAPNPLCYVWPWEESFVDLDALSPEERLAVEQARLAVQRAQDTGAIRVITVEALRTSRQTLEVSTNTNQVVGQIHREVSLLDRSPSEWWQWLIVIVVAMLVGGAALIFNFDRTVEIAGGVGFVSNPFYQNWVLSGILALVVGALVAYVPHWPKAIDDDEFVVDVALQPARNVRVTDSQPTQPAPQQPQPHAMGQDQPQQPYAAWQTPVAAPASAPVAVTNGGDGQTPSSIDWWCHPMFWVAAILVGVGALVSIAGPMLGWHSLLGGLGGLAAIAGVVVGVIFLITRILDHAKRAEEQRQQARDQLTRQRQWPAPQAEQRQS
jgi:hypothetical protein